MSVLFQLLALHFLCDFPLQGDFMARGKNHKTPLPGVPWPLVLFGHGVIHAGAVGLFLPYFVVPELIVHTVTDYAKSQGWLGEGKEAFYLDQFIHVLSKICWVWMAQL